MNGYSFSVSINAGAVMGTVVLIILCLAGFAIVHILKMLRMYLIVMEKHIPIKRFIPVYLRTTFVNLIIPYKIGEVYRVGEFSHLLGGVFPGLFTVLTDRFFDTLALILILLPYQALFGKGVSVSVAVLSVFLILLIFGYVIFPSSYRYLNRYIIMSRTSKRSMAALKGLEFVSEWYEYVKELITGRYGLMMLFSFGAWIAEFLVLVGMSRIFGYRFSVSEFGEYISSIMSGSSTGLGQMYTAVGATIIAAAAIAATVVYLTGRNKE